MASVMLILSLLCLAAGLDDWAEIRDPMAATTAKPGFIDTIKAKSKDKVQKFKNWKARLHTQIKLRDLRKQKDKGSTEAPNDYDYTEEEMENLRVQPQFPWQLQSASKVAKKVYARFLRAGIQTERLPLTLEASKRKLLEGDRLELICPGLHCRICPREQEGLNLTSNRNPFHWTVNGVILKGRNPRPRFKVGFWDRALNIHPVLAEDSAHYECFQWEWDESMLPARKGQFQFQGQLTLRVRSLTEAIYQGMINFGLTAAFAFFLLAAWVPLYAFCIVRAGEKGLAQEDEADYRAFLKRQRPAGASESDYELPTEPKTSDRSARSAVTFVRQLEASRTVRL